MALFGCRRQDCLASICAHTLDLLLKCGLKGWPRLTLSGPTIVVDVDCLHTLMETSKKLIVGILVEVDCPHNGDGNKYYENPYLTILPQTMSNHFCWAEFAFHEQKAFDTSPSFQREMILVHTAWAWRCAELFWAQPKNATATLLFVQWSRKRLQDGTQRALRVHVCEVLSANTKPRCSSTTYKWSNYLRQTYHVHVIYMYIYTSISMYIYRGRNVVYWNPNGRSNMISCAIKSFKRHSQGMSLFMVCVFVF